MSIRDFQQKLAQNNSSDQMMAYHSLEGVGAKRLAQEATVMGWEPWPQD